MKTAHRSTCECRKEGYSKWCERLLQNYENRNMCGHEGQTTDIVRWRL